MARVLKELSRDGWVPRSPSLPTEGELKLGALQRIADATELMAKRYSELVSERDRYKALFEQERKFSDRYARRINALRGVITRMKRKEATTND